MAIINKIDDRTLVKQPIAFEPTEKSIAFLSANMLTRTNNLSDVADKSIARQNLDTFQKSANLVEIKDSGAVAQQAARDNLDTFQRSANLVEIKTSGAVAQKAARDNLGITMPTVDGAKVNTIGARVFHLLDPSVTSTWATIHAGGANNIYFMNSAINAFATIQVGDAYKASLRSLKTDIAPTKLSGLDVIENVEVVDFFMKTDVEKTKPCVGIIADDTDPIVSTPDQNSLDIANSIGLLFKAIQELSAQNKELARQNAELSERLEALNG